MIDRSEKLSIKKQAELLSLNRTSLYYKTTPISQEELGIKQIIDEIYTKHPDYGYRRMTTILNRDYHVGINRKRARRYMREMGIHQSLNYKTPAEYYLGDLRDLPAAG